MYMQCTFLVRKTCGSGAVYEPPTANRSDGVRHEHAYSRRSRSHARRCYDWPWKPDTHSNNGRVTGSVLSTHVHVLPGHRLAAADTKRKGTYVIWQNPKITYSVR